MILLKPFLVISFSYHAHIQKIVSVPSIPLKNSDPGSRAFDHLLLKSVFSHKHFEDNLSAKLASVHCYSLCFGVFRKTLSHRRNILKYLTILTVYDLAIVID